MTRRDYAADVRARLTKPGAVARALGLKLDHDAGSYALVLCPVHGEKNASCSVYRKGEKLKAKCWGCGWTGDLFGLIAAVEGLDCETQFREVLARGCELAGMSAEADELRGGKRAPERRERPVAPPTEPERDYPPASEVRDLWLACVPVTEEPSVRAMLEARNIDPRPVHYLGAARALHPDTHPSSVPLWARFRGRASVSQPWTQSGHRLLLPVYDSTGLMRSVRAWLVTDRADVPKRVPPSGYRASGLVLANARAVKWLRGDSFPSSIVVVEGEPDYLVRAVKFSDEAIVGVGSGSWTDEFAARVPYGSELSLLTHLDSAGDRYADGITKSVEARARVFRWTLPDEEAA